MQQAVQVMHIQSNPTPFSLARLLYARLFLQVMTPRQARTHTSVGTLRCFFRSRAWSVETTVYSAEGRSAEVTSDSGPSAARSCAEMPGRSAARLEGGGTGRGGASLRSAAASFSEGGAS